MWFLSKSAWSLLMVSQCLFIWNSILYFFKHNKPIFNNCYVRSPWAFPHLFTISIPPCGGFASFHACYLGLCAHCWTLTCSSHSPKLGRILCQTVLAFRGARDASSPSTSPAGWRDPRLAFSHLAIGQGAARQRASPTFCQPSNPKCSLSKSIYPEGGFLSTQSVKEPETALIFKVVYDIKFIEERKHTE